MNRTGAAPPATRARTGTAGWALARVHRLEYPLPVHYLCYATWGACYGISDLTQLARWPVLLAVVANLLPPVAMNALNTAVDVRTDLRNPDKRDLAVAVIRLGARRVAALALAEMAVSLAIEVGLSAWTGRWFITIAGAAMIALHLLYNLEPVHLKRRGLLNPVALGLGFGFLPCFVSYGAVQAVLTTPAWLVFLGLGLTVIGRALWWQVPDRDSDAATGIRTLAVRYGVTWTLLASCAIAVCGPVLLGWGLWLRSGPGWGAAAAVVGAVFVVGQLAVVRYVRAGGKPSSVRFRHRYMTPMMIANVVLAVLPLVALPNAG